MKETKIKIPAGCEVEKTKVVDGSLVITFKELKPKTWIEFCKTNHIKSCECWINADSTITGFGTRRKRHIEDDKNLLPNCKTAEAVLTLCQLIQLRDYYNQGWKPDWNNEDECKYCIDFIENKFKIYVRHRYSTLLYFKTEELCNMFFENFHTLIEKLKPLYGIM